MGTCMKLPLKKSLAGSSVKNRSWPKSGSITGFHRTNGFSPPNSNNSLKLLPISATFFCSNFYFDIKIYYFHQGLFNVRLKVSEIV